MWSPHQYPWPQRTMKLLPPRNFIPAGLIREAQFVFEPPEFTEKGNNGTVAQHAGNRYETKVHRYLYGLFPDQYLPAPWVRFHSQGQRRRWAEPDGLVIDIREGTIAIVEAKLSHTLDAWFQLRRLYEPLIRHIFGHSWSYYIVEICGWYDPAVQFPEKVCMAPDLSKLGINEYNVHIYNPKFDRYRGATHHR